MASRWYVILTQPRAEYFAAEEIAKDDIEYFFPCVKTVHSRYGHEDTPIFPGYIFLRCDPETDGWPIFRQRHRVAGWVRFGGEIPSIPDEAVAELKNRLEELNMEGGQWARFQQGDKVRVMSDTIAGLATVLESTKPTQSRVTVLLRFMGRLVRAQVSRDILWPADRVSPDPPRRPRRTRGQGRRISNHRFNVPAGA